MYLTSVELADFGAFDRLHWSLRPGEEAGWHVLVGVNGAGKSALLRAIAIASIGAREFLAARRPPAGFVRQAPRGRTPKAATIALRCPRDAEWDAALAGRARGGDYGFELTLTVDGDVQGGLGAAGRRWQPGDGWFCGGFGALRRFTGTAEPAYAAGFPRLAAHLTQFDDDAALGAAIGWLQALAAQAPAQLEQLLAFVNQPGLLPDGTRLAAVRADAVGCTDADGRPLPLQRLNEGDRAVLGIVLELLRLMARAYGERPLFTADGAQVAAPGVALIDEVEAHLHPGWQRAIGPVLTRLFPRLQFIVSTYSPFVCQGALPGSVWALDPDAADAPLRRIEGEQLQRILYGDVLHVFNSEAFGGLPTRSDAALRDLDRLAELNRLHARGELPGRRSDERGRLLARLRAVLPDGDR